MVWLIIICAHSGWKTVTNIAGQGVKRWLGEMCNPENLSLISSIWIYWGINNEEERPKVGRELCWVM